MVAGKIQWLDWTDEAFQRSRDENKPILLDISAVWCHWCHRLDQDTYSVHDIADYITSNFIPIRVDTDKRPDINRRYNMGGWPTTAFLAPDGRVIGGGTYMPPEQMRQVLRDVKSSWEKTSRTQPGPETQQLEHESVPVGSVSDSIIDEVIGDIANNFDPIYGGFGSQPKFPHTEANELALLKYHYTGNRQYLGIVATTLHNVGKSGSFDREMGGFFRYSTLRDWSVPHFEKMCEDNAKWLQLYLHASQLTRDPFYDEISRRIIDYVNTWLSDPAHGCFYGSQDADEKYYSASKADRAKLEAPYVDKNIYTTWNAMMIGAYLDAAFVLGEITLRDFALKSLKRLLELNYVKNEGMFHYHDGRPELGNQLADQMWTARILSHVFECTGNGDYLAIAEDLVSNATERLHDREHGGFFDIAADPKASGFLSKPAKPLDENSLAAIVLLKLHHVTGKEGYKKLAHETLERFVNIYSQFGIMAAEYAIAVDLLINEPTMVHIIGDTKNPQTSGLIAESIKAYEPRKTVRILDPSKDAETIAKLGYRPPQQPTAYVCVGRACTSPIVELGQIGPEINRMVASQFRR